MSNRNKRHHLSHSNLHNRLEQVHNISIGETSYTYDADGNLVQQVNVNGTVEWISYDGAGQEVEIGHKRSDGQVFGQVRIYHADRLRSVRWVTGGSGNLVASYVYEGFGKVVGQSGGGGGAYQFCGLWGYRNDQDAGLLHVGARYYEIETGRWVQKDPQYWQGYIY